MGWFRLTYNLDEGARITEVLRQLTEGFRERVGVEDFFRELLTRPTAVPGYFKELFQSQGVGGSFYGRRWPGNSFHWTEWKRLHGYDTRIGHRTRHLFESVTSPLSPFRVMKISKTRAVFGSAVVDTEDGKSRGEAYAAKFNERRPFIDAASMQNLRHYLLAGPGRIGFVAAGERLKAQLLSKAFRGIRKNRFGNIFPM